MAGPARPLLVHGGRLLDVRTATWQAGDLLLADGRIVALGPAGPGGPGGPDQLGVDGVPGGVRRIDAGGLLLAPGLVDAQVNGAGGADLTAAPERLPEVARALLRYGVTAFVPTVVSSAPGTVERAVRAAAALDPAGAPAAHVVGVHAEGPFLAPQRRGAHPLRHLRAPDPALVAGWSRAAGVVAVTLAPELPGALDLVRTLAGRGVLVSIGHTEATHAQAMAAAAAGATAVTHLFNAMPPLRHREPGVVGAVLDGATPNDGTAPDGGTAPAGRGSAGAGLVAGVIVDGHHVHPAVVRTGWRTLGPRRFMLVSDATAALGLPDGPTVLGEQPVVLREGAVRLAADPGTLAGSAAGLDHCVRTLVAITGCPPAEALVAATRTPADLLRRPDLGRLEVGARADVTLWTPDLALAGVIAAGRLLED